MLYCFSECCRCCLCCYWREYYSTSMRCWFGGRYISRHNHIVGWKHNENHTSCDAITSDITTLWHDKMLSITTTTITINNVKRDRKRIWRTDRLVGVFLSGVARIWCQEGHKSYCVFTLGDCRHCTTTITINNVKRDRKRIWRTDRLAGVFLSGVARIWCQEGHRSYCVFTLGDCRHCRIVYYEERN